jgi:hypothetical protein
MSKIQTICCLFLFLVLLFSMDMIFGNIVRENFRGGGGVGGGGGLSRGLNGAGANIGRGLGLGLGVTALREQQLANYNYNSTDDQPFYYGFPLFNQTQ